MVKMKDKLNKALSFLDLPPNPLIGVDVSTSSIKMVEISLSRSKEGYVLNSYSIEPTPKDAFSDNGVVNPESLGQAVQRAWKQLGSKTKSVAVALPNSAVIMKKVKFSGALDDDALGEEVMIEANQHIPFSLDEVHIDWSIIGPWPNQGTGGSAQSQDSGEEAPDNEVLICAARKERMEEFIAAIEIAGLKANVVDVESHAQQSSFNLILEGLPNLQNQVVALVDAGGTVMTINVFQRGETIFSKELPFGSHQLTDAICHSYGISEAEAEEAKRKNGNGLENYHNQILLPFLDSMGMEINRALQFFLTQATVEQIDMIILSGGCAAYEGVNQAVADITQVETMIANPFALMDLSSSVKNKSLVREAPLLMTACGLALRAFDK